MSVLKNLAVFKNWYLFYAGRYGLLHKEFEIVLRSGLKVRVRPHTDDLSILKSNFVTGHYLRGFSQITKGSVVVDAGAHIGCFSLLAATTACKVLAFEPEPSNYQMLRKNVKLNNLKNVSTFEMAVSGECGYQEMAIYGEGSTGSHSLYSGSAAPLEKKRVETISIGEIMKRESLPRIDFLKLDCEGAEHDIFKTMDKETASRIMAVAMESHGIPGSCIDLPLRLRELGFEVKEEEGGGYVYARRAVPS